MLTVVDKRVLGDMQTFQKRSSAMDDEQREELEDEAIENADKPLQFDPAESRSTEDVVDASAGLADGAELLQVDYRQSDDSSELSPTEFKNLDDALPVGPELQLATPTEEAPPGPLELGGDKTAPGRLYVGPQPHARRAPIMLEPQPTFEAPEDLAGIPGGRFFRPDPTLTRAYDKIYRYGDAESEPRAHLYSSSQQPQTPAAQTTPAETATEVQPSSGERGQTLPRLLVIVSMANARSIFQQCLERASLSLGAKFHNACQQSVNEYARERRAAERAASR
jgi:hypothetical protein